MIKRVVALLLVVLTAKAEDSSELDHYKKALQQTQHMIINKTQREQAIQQSSPEGQKAAARIKELAGDSKTEEEYYKLAAEIFGGYKNEDEMNKSLMEGTRNPAEFYNKLTPEQRAKIQEFSRKLNPAGADLNNP